MAPTEGGASAQRLGTSPQSQGGSKVPPMLAAPPPPPRHAELDAVSSSSVAASSSRVLVEATGPAYRTRALPQTGVESARTAGHASRGAPTRRPLNECALQSRATRRCASRPGIVAFCVAPREE